MSTNQFKSSDGYRRIIKALIYSLQGIKDTYKYEAAFRQEVILALVMIPLGLILGRSYIDKILLCAPIILILIIEIINSAIESLADAISKEHNPLLGRAKDQASAAVFLSIVLSCFIWLVILIKYLI